MRFFIQISVRGQAGSFVLAIYEDFDWHIYSTIWNLLIFFVKQLFFQTLQPLFQPLIFPSESGVQSDSKKRREFFSSDLLLFPSIFLYI
jgi:hypothetical protein